MALNTRKILPALAFPFFFICIGLIVFLFRSEVSAWFRDPEALKGRILSTGAWGPSVFVLVQAIQVLIFVIPGEVAQVAGGWLFGSLLGTMLSLLGITIGSFVNFSVGRLLGKPFVMSLFGEKRLEELSAITSSPKAAFGFFILFVIPGIPKDALCYAAGLSAMKFPAFLLISMAGRIPGIFGSSLMGSAASEGNYSLAVGILIGAAVLFAFGLLFRKQIQERIGGLLLKRREMRK